MASLERPRKIIIMVKAGDPTDAVIDELAELLEPGDILIDGGNAKFSDTIRREAALRDQRHPLRRLRHLRRRGGRAQRPVDHARRLAAVVRSLGPILEKISAHVDGEPCCTHIGTDGAGHFVKMVHNGIEYADMQLIAEAYDLLRRGAGLEPAEIADVFADWNSGELDSFLIEITAEVLAHVDAATGKPFVDVVLDAAGMKGTGTWTVQTALDLGVPVSGIAEAVFARGLSSLADQRAAARQAARAGYPWQVKDVWPHSSRTSGGRCTRPRSSPTRRDSTRSPPAAAEYGWDIDRGAVARIWRGGCIIRAAFLNRITEAYDGGRRGGALRSLAAGAVLHRGDRRRAGLLAAGGGRRGPVRHPDAWLLRRPAYYDGLRSERLPAALIQGQRDFFGAHTYRGSTGTACSTRSGPATAPRSRLRPAGFRPGTGPARRSTGRVSAVCDRTTPAARLTNAPPRSAIRFDRRSTDVGRLATVAAARRRPSRAAIADQQQDRLPPRNAGAPTANRGDPRAMRRTPAGAC